MYALLQIYPPEAMAEDHSDAQCCLDIIAVDASKTTLEHYLAKYERRYRAAFDAWDDDQSDEWGPEHDAKLHDVENEHGLHDYGAMIRGAKFKIVRIRDAPFQWFLRRRKPQLIRDA